MKKTLLAIALAIPTLCSSAFADVIKLGTHPTFAPFEYIDEKGEVIGFDIDLVKEIAAQNGDTVEVVSMPFDGLIPALLVGQIDAIAAGMTITDERLKKVDFSEGYYKSTLSAVIKKEYQDKYKSLADLKDKKVCVQIGTTAHTFGIKEKLQLSALDSHADSMLELNNDGCFAIINDRPVNLYYVTKTNTDKFVELKDAKLTENADVFGIAVKKGNKELLDKLNSGFVKIKDNGSYKELNKKWFGVEE